ncbi:MAG TPA: YciI family protein [Thermoanaerobaculia bacterium]|nr:YciI family protein [Thermoanaerobaculia bacterium]
MPKYILLLHETPGDFAHLSPEQMQAIVEKYSAWLGGLQAAGRMAGGEKLKDDGGLHLRRADRTTGQLAIQDGPYSETKEVLGGYFLIEAAGRDEAVEIARGCPHLENGWIELREIDPTA